MAQNSSLKQWPYFANSNIILQTALKFTGYAPLFLTLQLYPIDALLRDDLSSFFKSYPGININITNALAGFSMTEIVPDFSNHILLAFTSGWLVKLRDGWKFDS